MRLRGPVIFGFVLAVGVIAMVPMRSAVAAAPSSLTYGWWSQQNVGGAVGSPDVPSDGLLVQNDPAGELAVSAVRFPVAPGKKASLQLTVSGQAVQAQPVKACLLTSTFTPVEGGTWADRPKYDCTSPLTASATSAGYDFQLTALARDGFVAVAILAGGAADRVAFQKPTATVSEAAAAPPPPAPAAAPAPAPAPQAAAPPSFSFPQPVPAAPPVAAAVPPPVALGPTPAVGGPRAVRAAPIAPAVAESAGERLRRSVGTLGGVGLLIALIVYWADGFGAVRLRWAGSTYRPAPAA